MSSNDYDEENPCKHGEAPRSRCTICRGTPDKRVDAYYTSGGNCYHLDINCEARESGQAKVDAKGGTRSDIKHTYVDVIRVERDPCRICGIGWPRTRDFESDAN